MGIFKSAKNVGKKILTGSLLSLVCYSPWLSKELLAKEIPTQDSTKVVCMAENSSYQNQDGSTFKINSLDLIKNTLKPLYKTSIINSPFQKKEFDLNFDNPSDNFNSDIKLWYSMDDIFAKGNDYLGINAGFDNNIFGRLFLAYTDYYFSDFFRYLGHEISHNFEIRKHGVKDGFDIDFGNWNNTINIVDYLTHLYTLQPHFMQPEIPLSPDSLSKDEFYRNVINGLNFDELFAKKSWQNSMQKKETNFEDAMSFFLSKTLGLAYSLNDGYKDVLLTKIGLDQNKLMCYLYDNNYSLGDVDQYSIYLRNDGINLSKKDYLKQVLVSDLTTWHLWESMYSILRYLYDGTRTENAFEFDINDKVQMSPPLISNYATPKGSFYDLSSVINSKNNNIAELSFGTDLDFTGDGKVNNHRAGGKYNVPMFNGIFRLSPYTYADFDRGFNYKGSSIGFESLVELIKGIGIIGNLGLNNNDLLENTIKGEPNGFNYELGIEAKF